MKIIKENESNIPVNKTGPSISGTEGQIDPTNPPIMKKRKKLSDILRRRSLEKIEK